MGIWWIEFSWCLRNKMKGTIKSNGQRHLCLLTLLTILLLPLKIDDRHFDRFSGCFGRFYWRNCGGGGLVQTPVLFMTFPQYLYMLLGTTNLFSGTAVSLANTPYKHDPKLVVLDCAGAFAAMTGSLRWPSSAMLHSANHSRLPDRCCHFIRIQKEFQAAPGKRCVV